VLNNLGSHTPGLKGNHVVPILIVEPPFWVKQTTLCFQALVKRCSWEGSKVIEGGEIEFLLNGITEGLIKTRFSIIIITEDEGDIEADIMTVQIC